MFVHPFPKNIQNTPIPMVGVSYSLWPSFSLCLFILLEQFAFRSSFSLFASLVSCKFRWIYYFLIFCPALIIAEILDEGCLYGSIYPLVEVPSSLLFSLLGI